MHYMFDNYWPAARMHVSRRIVVYFVLCSVFFCVNETAQPAGKTTPRTLDRLVYPGEFNYQSGVSLQHTHHHHNHPEDEDYNDGLGDKPSNSVSSGDARLLGNKTKIPVSFIREINEKEYTVNDLLLHFVDDYDDDEFIENRFGEGKAVVTLAKEAKCMPELRTVQLVENKDPSILYIPSCTRIERCGGCCMHDLLECQPTEVDTINIKVIKVTYEGGKSLKYAEKEIVSVDKHKSCKCDCKVREADCTAVQVYEKSECKCSCRNTDEEKKCLKENSTKLWNPNACACQCRQELMCTTGSVFDWRECKCVVKQVRRRNIEQPRRVGHRNEAMFVVPLRDDNF